MQAEVRLAVPASPEFVRITRMMVAGVASRAGFTLDGVEDLRTAVTELCATLVGRGRGGTLTLRYLVLADGLAVEGTGRFDDAVAEGPRLSPLSARILGATVDECELANGPEGPAFRILKRLPSAEEAQGSE